jgi:hypothetical protein
MRSSLVVSNLFQALYKIINIIFILTEEPEGNGGVQARHGHPTIVSGVEGGVWDSPTLFDIYSWLGGMGIQKEESIVWEKGWGLEKHSSNDQRLTVVSDEVESMSRFSTYEPHRLWQCQTSLRASRKQRGWWKKRS